MERLNLICDVDGTLTSGEHFYSENGKEFKAFGSNEKDALAPLRQYVDRIVFCSADVQGENINRKRLTEFPGVEYVRCSITDRQALIDSCSPCIYIGDGMCEPKAAINICLSDSAPQAIENADVVLPTTAGKNVLPHLLDWLEKYNIYRFGTAIGKALRGKVILTGVGKNFSLAQLVSEFFLPYNLVAVPLDANHSLHGSLGMIREEDVLIASSKSGNTRELLEMMEALKRKLPAFRNTFLITSNGDSQGAAYFENVLVVEPVAEDSLHGLSPQATIAQYLKIYFRILNIINLDNSCTKTDYLANHQGGSIGQTKV